MTVVITLLFTLSRICNLMSINKQDGYSPILLTSLRHWMENRGTVGFDVIISTARIFLRLTSVA